MKKAFRTESGFTLPELLVASGIGLLVMAMALGSTLDSKRNMQRDLVRTRVTQNLRSGIDLLGIDIRIAGENLPSQIPAIEIINGEDGAPDELVLRRGLLPETFTACSLITGGTTAAPEVGLLNGLVTNPGAIDQTINSCDPADPGFVTRVDIWENFINEQGGQVQAYIFDVNARVGEFFTTTGFETIDTSVFLSAPAGTFEPWQNDYNLNSVLRPTTILLAEEWRYRLVNDKLQLIINNDEEAPLNVISRIENVQFAAILEDGTELEELTSNSDWTSLSAIRVTIDGLDTANGNELRKQESGQFFPRNVLSH